MPETITRENIIIRYIAETDKFNRETKKVERGLGGLGGKLKGISGTIKGFLAGAGITAALGVANSLIQTGITAAAQFEQTAVSFEVFTGSVEAAKELLAELEEFSIVTPFAPAQVQNAAKTLLGFGRTATEVTEDIAVIGEAAAATSADLGSLAVVFGQVAGIGKLTGQDALQLINQGIPLYQILAESIGVSVTKVKELQTQGKITFEVLNQAFKDAAEEGGKFANALEKQSQTLAGLRSTLAGVREALFRALGARFLEPAKALTRTFINLGNSLLDVITPAKTAKEQFIETADELDRLDNNIQPLIDRYKELKNSTQLSAEEQRELKDIIQTLSLEVDGAATSFDQFGNALDVNILTVENYVERIKELNEEQREIAVRDAIRDQERFGETIEKQTNRLNKANNNLKNYRTELDALRRVQEEGTSLTEQQTRRFGFLATEIGRLPGVIRELESSLDDLNAKYKEAEESQRLLEGATRDFTRFNVDAELQLNSSSFAIEQYIDTLRRLKDENSDNILAVRQYDKQIAELEQRLTKVIDLESRQERTLANVRRELGEARKSLNGLTTSEVEQRDAIQGTIKALEQEEKALLDFLGLSKEAKERRDAEAGSIAALKKELSELNTEIQKTDVDSSELPKLVEKAEELEEALSNAELKLRLLRDPTAIPSLFQEGLNDLREQEALLERLVENAVFAGDLTTAKVFRDQLDEVRLKIAQAKDAFEELLNPSDPGIVGSELAEAAAARLLSIARAGIEAREEAIEFDRQIQLQAAEETIENEQDLARRRIGINLDADLRIARNRLALLDPESAAFVELERKITALEQRAQDFVGGFRIDTAEFEEAGEFSEFGDFDVIKAKQKAFQRAFTSSAKAFGKQLLQNDVDNANAAIRLQENKVREIARIASDGNAEQLQLEEERLSKLLEEREKAIARQRALAAIEIAVSQGIAAANTIQAVTDAAKQPFPLNIAAVALVVGTLTAQVASAGLAISQAFAGIQTFDVGTESVGGGSVDGKGGQLAVVHKGERILTKDQNKKLLRLGVKNDDIPELVLKGLNSTHVDEGVIIMPSNTELLSETKMLRKELRRTLKEVSGVYTEVIYDEHGIRKKERKFLRNKNRIRKLKR